MREVVILFEPFAGLGENGMKLSPQRAVLDIFDFATQLDSPLPDFARRQLGKGAPWPGPRLTERKFPGVWGVGVLYGPPAT
jgi:hypothetical protein